MKKLILIALIVLATNVNGQSSKTISKPSEFSHPVMLKLIQGEYFPLSEKTGEMLIVEKSNLTNLDLSYEEAMKIILPK